MPTSEETTGNGLETRVWKIYSHLYKIYRRGAFERELECYRCKWPELDDNDAFYVYRAPVESGDGDKLKITYAKAVENVYQLVLFLERNKETWVRKHQVKTLQIRNLIYEVKDYSLAVPPELGKFFLEQAKTFTEHVRRKQVESFADEFRGRVSVLPEDFDARTRVIKVQIIAALCGVNYQYRSHAHRNYKDALEIVESIEGFVKNELPLLHRNRRESFGLTGLTMFLKGKLLAAIGDYDEAQKAFAESSDAYIARLDQKNEFFERGFITRRQYEDKKIVTLRRTALVSALGVGYLAFVNSRISKALSALRMSRAALKQNVGAVYTAFTDVLFFACRRAEGSSDRQTIEEVIRGIETSRDTLAKLVPDSHYLHRAGVELAIALYYRAKADQKSDEATERTSEDLAKAMSLLDAAIKHGETANNQRLLTEGLFVRSYVQRCLPDVEPQRNLQNAEEDAKRAFKEAMGNSRMELEALVALGSLQYEQSKYHKSTNNEEGFRQRVIAAQNSFHKARTQNHGKNVRIEAVCCLKLAKLSLLDPSSVALAHDFFRRWEEIENRVEHAFCHYMARDIRRRLSEGGPLLIIDAESSLSFPNWEEKLLTHLINTMLIKLSKQTGQHNTKKELHSLIVRTLRTELKLNKDKAYKITDDLKLVEELQRRHTKRSELL